jgi:hypothetical protein
MDILTFYQKAKALCITNGYQNEIDGVEKRKIEDQTADDFGRQFMYVILNSGMNNKIAEGIYIKAMKHGMTAIGHPGKRAAIEEGLIRKQEWFNELKTKKTLNEQLVFLESLPWIGPITKYHLARNLGIDVAKPDRHMVRVAHHFNLPNIQKMCEAISLKTGERVGTVDVIIWRAMHITNGKILEDAGGA